MRRVLLAAGLVLSMLEVCLPAFGQVIGIVPTAQAEYYWNSSTLQWAACPSASTSGASVNPPQAVAQYGFNSGLNQWTPFTACPGTGSGGLTTFTSGALYPLFTTGLGVDPLHNPALTFSLISTPTGTFLGNFSGSTGPWATWTLAQGSNITLTPSGSTLTVSAAAAANTVSNSDGSLTISPTSGAVVASLNPSHSNSWVVQTFANLIDTGAEAGSGSNCLKIDTSGNITNSGLACGLVAGGTTGAVVYQSAANATAFLASPTTSGHVFGLTWQPGGSALPPVALDFNTWNAIFASMTTGTGSSACGSASGCIAFAEGSTAGTPAGGSDYIRADATTHQFLQSTNGGAEVGFATTGTPTAGQAACIKSTGPPVVIGYCSSVVSSGGACTCN